MPLRGLERDNIAREMVAPNSGAADAATHDQHYTSFEFYPFHEGMTFALYKGLLSTESRRAKTFCVVKALLVADRDLALLNGVVSAAKEARRLASKFNAVVGYEAVTFPMPGLARVENVSDFVGLFRCILPHEKRLKVGEVVVVEDFIDGDFAVFNTSNGSTPHVVQNASSSSSSSSPQSQQQQQQQMRKTSAMIKRKKRNTLFSTTATTTNMSDSRERTSRSDGGSGRSNGGILLKDRSNSSSCSSAASVGSTNLAQAFTHFTWHETGNLVVSDLKGVLCDNAYNLSTPTVHSTDSNFGPSDRGPSAIAEVFASHRCTNVCRDWRRFVSPGSSNAKNQINFCDQSSIDPNINLLVSESFKSTNKNAIICTFDNKLY